MGLSVSSEFGSSIQPLTFCRQRPCILVFQYPRSSDRLFNAVDCNLVAGVKDFQYPRSSDRLFNLRQLAQQVVASNFQYPRSSDRLFNSLLNAFNATVTKVFQYPRSSDRLFNLGAAQIFDVDRDRKSFSILGVRIVYSTVECRNEDILCFDLSVSSEFGSSILGCAQPRIKRKRSDLSVSSEFGSSIPMQKLAPAQRIHRRSFSILGVRIVYSTLATVLISAEQRSFSILGVRIVYSTNTRPVRDIQKARLSVSSEFGSSIQLRWPARRSC